MKANLPRTEPEMLAWWDAMGLYKRLREAAAGRPLWILHDGPPYANGHIHMGTRPEQGPQGHDREVARHARLRRGVRPRLGLPRLAHRAPGGHGAGTRQRLGRRPPRHGSRGEAPALPRVRPPLHRHPARGVPPPRGLRRLGESVSHDDPGVPGGHRPRAGTLRGPRARLQGAQARPLVHVLQDGPRPGRGGVRESARPVRLREVSPGGSPSRDAPTRRDRRW